MSTLRAVRLLNLRRIRNQPLRATLAVIAVAAGVSLAVATLVDQTSFSYALHEFGRQVSGPAPIRVSGASSHGGVSQATLDRVAAVPGVGAAVPVVQTVTHAVDSRGRQTLITAFGVDCRAEALLGRIGCSPEAVARAKDTDPPILSARLSRQLGSAGVIRTDAGRSPIAGGLTAPQLDRFNAGRVAIFPLPVAQRIFMRPGAYDALYVVPQPGAPVARLRADVARAAGPWNQVHAGAEPPREARQPGPTFSLLFVIGLFALAIGAQLVYNTITLSLEERRKELAIAGALGGTAGLIIGGALVEAGLLGLAGGLIGVAGGIVAAGPLVAGLSTFIEKFAGIHIGVHVTPMVVVAGAVMGVLVSVLAALPPARRATRVDVASELHDQARRAEAAPVVRYRQGVVLLILGAVGLVAMWIGNRDGSLATWQPLLAEAGLLMTTVSTFRAVGQFTPGVLRLLRRFRPMQQGPARVALANLLREPKRTSVMAIAVGTAVGLACVLGSLLPAISEGAREFSRKVSAGRVWVSNLPSNNSASIDAKVSPGNQDALARIPGVADIDRSYFVGVDAGSLGLINVDGFDGRVNRYRVYRGVTGDVALARGEVMVGPALARKQHLHPGSALRLPGRDGFVDLRVGGIWGDPNGLGVGVTMSSAKLFEIWGPQPASEMYIQPAPGISAESLAAKINAAHLEPELRALPPDPLADDIAHDVQGFTTPFWALQRALLLVAIIATLSTMLLVGIQRRREQGLLAALGMGPGDLARMTLIEAGAVGLSGAVLGALASVASYAGLALVAPILTGLQPPFQFDLVAPVGYGMLGTACVVAGAAWPAWRTSRLEVIAALQYE